MFTLPPVWVQSIVISISVCLSVCPLTYLKIHLSKFNKIFNTFKLVPFDDSAMGYVLMVFLTEVMFSHNGANGPESMMRMFHCVRQVAAAVRWHSCCL